MQVTRKIIQHSGDPWSVFSGSSEIRHENFSWRAYPKHEYSSSNWAIISLRAKGRTVYSDQWLKSLTDLTRSFNCFQNSEKMT